MSTVAHASSGVLEVSPTGRPSAKKSKQTRTVAHVFSDALEVSTVAHASSGVLEVSPASRRSEERRVGKECC